MDSCAEIIGKENLIVRIYEKGQFCGKRQDVISDFLYALQIKIDWNKCVISRYNNPSLSGNFVEIKRRMNLFLHPSPQVFDLENVLSEYLMQRQKVSKVRNADGMFTPEQRQAFLKQFEHENAEIARQYLDRKDGILFYDHQPVPMYTLNESTLHDDIKGLFSFLFANWKNVYPYAPLILYH